MVSVVAEAYCAELPTSKGCVLTARRELDMVSSGILAMLGAAAAIILTANPTELHTQNLCRIVDAVVEAVADDGSARHALLRRNESLGMNANRAPASHNEP